ncbi:peroxide stress protein YaaA [Amphibiibacter pelophylacis]|uniref:Peroxide stress protein YaaA n=1 Tax=Amphibiibacter pelophylacis TaxID=1799477 RepID=A0ACC6P5C6_9BURK
MLLVISPAKALDYDTPVPDDILQRATRPQWVDESGQLIALMRERSPAQVAQLMHLSDALAQLNVARYAAWRPRFGPGNSKPAVLAFNGDVYDGLDARSLSADDLDWAQQHLAILSGLHGVLRPLDWLQPYRLEMGTALAGPHGRNLYDFWGGRIATELDRRCRAAGRTEGAGQADGVIVNLASQEYFRAARPADLRHRVVHCQFEDWNKDRYSIISFYAKRARGLMARWAITRRATRVADLLDFDLDGYALAPQDSTAERLVFRRRLATPG